MNVKLSSTATDNITDLLNQIIDFTERREEVLTRNLFDHRSTGFVPKDLPVHEFTSTLTRALAEHIHTRRLLLEDSNHIHFHDHGEFDASAIADTEALTLLESDPQTYIQEQLRKLSENTIHNRLAVELLRQKRQKEIEFINS
jgi:flagellar basal body rod protein FlgB